MPHIISILSELLNSQTTEDLKMRKEKQAREFVARNRLIYLDSVTLKSAFPSCKLDHR